MLITDKDGAVFDAVDWIDWDDEPEPVAKRCWCGHPVADCWQCPRCRRPLRSAA
jgi:hypothetical protein